MSYFTRRTLFATVTVFGGKVKALFALGRRPMPTALENRTQAVLSIHPGRSIVNAARGSVGLRP